MKLRFLPIVIAIYGLIIVGKIFNLFERFSNNKNEMSIFAELSPKIAIANESENKPSSEKKEAKISDNFKNNEIIFDSKSAEISKQKPSEVIFNSKECSEVEVDLLKTLSKRREELEKWTLEAKNKEIILKAAESKLDIKLNELKSLKEELTSLLALYNEKEDMKIKSLVKIYESMKPKDAAQIFEQLDMQILLQVIDNMKETKVAPILASVNPQKAKEITVEFANQKKMSNEIS